MGGVDEIGSNMTVFETEKEYLIIDYGILFPMDEVFELNYLIVDYSDLNPKKKTTLFITHGHEDHIGAVSHIVNYFDNFKVYAPEFAAALIRKKLLQRKLICPIKIYKADDQINFDGFKIHPIHVTHSIPHTYGLIVKGKGISALFISDFKVDLNPLYEKPFDIKKIKELFNTSDLRLCFLDSTNILNPGKTPSERDLLDDLDHLISKKQRTFITLFSSNIHRLRTIFEIAKNHNKKITAVGRSIYNYLEAAKECKLLNYEDFNFISEKSINNPNSDNLVVLLTGCQGDFMGALNRLSNNEHKSFKFNENDQIIFSSKPIPGNGKKISKIYNKITSFGTTIYTDKDYLVHASGHPGQEDLKILMNEINPTHYIPIHGETYFLKKHKEFINKEYSSNTIFMRNFDSILINKDLEIKIQNNEPKEPLLIHGDDLIIERENISKRRKIASQGVVFISIDEKDKSLKISYEGLPDSIKENLDKIYEVLLRVAFSEHRKSKPQDRAEGVRVKTRQVFKQHLGYRPIAMVHSK
jgi:ribonuclease J